MMKGSQVKFSLSGRDGDSNRFLPSCGIIPNTHPSIPREGSLRSPLVQLRNQIRGYDQRRTIREPLCQGWSGLQPALGLTPMALRTSLLPSRVRTFTANGPGLNWTTRLRGRNDLSGQLCERLRSTWQDDLQRSVLKRHRRNHYNTTYKTPPGLHLFHITRLCSTIAQYSQPWLSYHL